MEGDSAGGSAKQGRNRANQAVLPLRGKILNTYVDVNDGKKNGNNNNGSDHRTKALSKMISSNEILTLINALGLDPKSQEIDLKDLRYGKITVQLQMGWYYHEKVRDISVITDKGTLIWNDDENKSRWINQTIENGRQIQHMDQNKSFENTETSLQRQITAFVDYCEKDKLPDSDMAHTKRVTYIVECMEKSLKTGEVICPSKEY